MLIFARIIQASGTAIMVPLLMTTVMTLAPPESRGKTMGFISTVISVAPAIGPTISGVILNYLNWRWLFLLVLPISLGALALGARRMQNVTTPHHAPIDAVSVVLSGLAFGGLVYGLSHIGDRAAPGSLPAGVVSAVGAAYPGGVHLPPDLVAENGLSTARPAHLRVAQLHGVGAAHGES